MAHVSDYFDPASWLSALTTIGGGYALMSDRRLAFVVNECPAEELTAVMAQIVGDADRQEAVKRNIEERQEGRALA
jgi:hypothetical protein